MTKEQREQLCAELEKAYQALNEAIHLYPDKEIIWARGKVVRIMREQIAQIEEKESMDKITVQVGSIVSGSSGQTNDSRREVEFARAELASTTEYGFGRGGDITDTRGVTETLYETDDGRLVVHVEDWSHWQGEPTTCTLHEVTPEDLDDVNSKYADLGAEAGYGRPLTLDEALAD